MSTLAGPRLSPAPDDTRQAPVLEIVVPVHNEEHALPRAIAELTRHLEAMPWSWRITIADNASTDRTAEVARELARRHGQVRVVRLPLKGRGRALRWVWSRSDADVLAYTDVDLSTGLDALLPLVAPLVSGHSDVAIGTRLSRGSRVTRGPRREVISRSYNALLRGVLGARFSDAQCGFKAVRREVAAELLPLIQDETWFFDTELLVLAERAGLRIHEVPVDWIDDPDSRVDVWRTAFDDLRGIRRLAWASVTGRLPIAEVATRLGRAAGKGNAASQLVLFALVGVACTAAYALLFLALRQVTGAQAANLAALLFTAIGNTAANRRLTFGVRGPGRLKHQLQGLAVFGLGLAATSGVLAMLERSGTSHTTELVALTATNLAVTVLRFAAMRWWIFAGRDRARHGPRNPGTLLPLDRVAPCASPDSLPVRTPATASSPGTSTTTASSPTMR